MIDQTKRILSDLIAFPTVSADSNLDMIAYLANHLENCGAQVDILPDESGQKANLFATFGPMREGGIVLSGHCDVVPVTDQEWNTDPFKLIERDGLLFGRGTCDMKGFLAAVLATAPLFAEHAHARPLHVALTYDEETGCIGAGQLVHTLKERSIKPSFAIIGEPTSMQIIDGHKGCCEYSTYFQGLEGHGSAPDLGLNAIEFAAKFVMRLLELRDELITKAPLNSRFDPPWTTLNIGALNGGHVHNVIPSKARVDWEMRPVQASDVDFVKEALAAVCDEILLPQMRTSFPDAMIATEVIGEVAGLMPTRSNEAFEVVSRLTGANSAQVVSFGTEAGLFQSLDMDVVVCGPGSIEQAHKANEFVAIDQLVQCLKLLQGLAVQLSETENWKR
ncbi:MAG: acetylornithine deacetylase [Paracoccaceae bacterium]